MIEKLEEYMTVTALLHAMTMFPNSHTREIKVILMEFHLYYDDYIKIGRKSYYFVKYFLVIKVYHLITFIVYFLKILFFVMYHLYHLRSSNLSTRFLEILLEF